MHTLGSMKTPDMPLTYGASNVYPYLWIGPIPPEDHELTDFAAVVLCAKEYQPPALSFRGPVWRVRLEDWEVPLSSADAHAVARAGRAVAKLVANGQHVLVTCFAGLNRSALVVGTALLELGFEPADAVTRIQLNHSLSALNNRAFVRHLHEYGRQRAQRA